MSGTVASCHVQAVLVSRILTRNVSATLPVEVLETALALQGDRVSYDSAKVYKKGKKIDITTMR